MQATTATFLAGGVVTDDAIRSLAISQRLLGTEEIILIHHTGCGMLTFTEDGLKGQIEAIPLPADSIDVVISNCVINLAADKSAVFREIARVLKPGGRMGITDIVAEDRLTAEERAERGSYTGCIAGALSISEFRAGLEAAGLHDVTLTRTHDVADGMISAIVQARKPHDAAPGVDLSRRLELPIAAASGCCGGTGCC